MNRLNRELSILRARQRGTEEVESSPNAQNCLPGSDPRFPSPEAMLDAMRKENESLRNRLVDTERDYVRIARLNEVYREELIDHRRRVGGSSYRPPYHFLCSDYFHYVAWFVCRQPRGFTRLRRRPILTTSPSPVCLQLSKHLCLPPSVVVCSSFSSFWCSHSKAAVSASPTECITACRRGFLYHHASHHVALFFTFSVPLFSCH